MRVYVESHCRYMDAMDRAAEIFFSLKMEATEQRNAVFGVRGIEGPSAGDLRRRRHSPESGNAVLVQFGAGDDRQFQTG